MSYIIRRPAYFYRTKTHPISTKFKPLMLEGNPIDAMNTILIVKKRPLVQFLVIPAVNTVKVIV